MGADDYIAKPFNPRVVVARVKAVLRRTGALAVETVTTKTSGLHFNGWRLDTGRCQLFNAQAELVDLTQGEYGLLLALMQNSRKVLSRERLLELTHSESLEVFDRTIDVLIMRLRKKIEPNPHQPALIRTIRGVGYVFSADVIHAENNAA
jgi:DNA-binding response OmpR family regulator